MRINGGPGTAGWYGLIAVMALCTLGTPRAQGPASVEAAREGLDFVLDMYVRDGYVYYRALKIERGRLDGYLRQIANVDVDRLGRNEQIAFWLNAYNALVLRTVIDHYPVPRRSADYPPGSIRQVPGAFERLTHRVAGRMVTLDQIEQTVLPAFGDPRVHFALGRGAVDGGRLRSEAFTPAALERQLSEVAAECVTRAECMQIDRTVNALMASSIFSWREKEFVEGYADKAPPIYATRSPVERAILAFVQPNLLQTERDFLERNNFRLAYRPFNWSLNDLTGRGGQ